MARILSTSSGSAFCPASTWRIRSSPGWPAGYGRLLIRSFAQPSGSSTSARRSAPATSASDDLLTDYFCAGCAVAVTCPGTPGWSDPLRPPPAQPVRAAVSRIATAACIRARRVPSIALQVPDGETVNLGSIVRVIGLPR